MEQFIDIPGYEGLYQISVIGNVKSLPKKRGSKTDKILKKTETLQGYYMVRLYNNSGVKPFYIHQLVAMAFLNHVPNGFKLVINHIDFDKKNNCIDNLEIVTNRLNSNHKHIKSSSKYTGVSWHDKSKKWFVKIYHNGKHKYIGTYDCEIEASKAYKNYIKKFNL